MQGDERASDEDVRAAVRTAIKYAVARAYEAGCSGNTDRAVEIVDDAMRVIDWPEQDRVTLAAKDEEIAALRAERDREERDAAELMDERDHLERQIEDIYHTLGGTEEWSNCCDLGDEAEEMAGDMRAELSRLRAEHAACVEALGLEPPDTLLAACERVGKGAPRLMAEVTRLRARDERTARVIEAARRFAQARRATDAAERDDDHDAYVRARIESSRALAALDAASRACSWCSGSGEVALVLHGERIVERCSPCNGTGLYERAHPPKPHTETEAAHDLGASCGASVEERAAHRWSGWPGAWCLDCGIQDPREACLASGECPCSDQVAAPCKVRVPPCTEPGSRRHDPYAERSVEERAAESAATPARLRAMAEYDRRARVDAADAKPGGPLALYLMGTDAVLMEVDRGTREECEETRGRLRRTVESIVCTALDAEGPSVERAAEPVCTVCNDSHRVPVPEERAARGDAGPFGDGTWMCTSCPTPCQDCRAGGRGAYCETTPCPCECHRKRAERNHARAQQRIGACLSMPAEHTRGPSGAADSWRGHPIARVNAETYVYTDTGAPVRDDPHRPCGACGRPDTPEGHDGCLGTLPDVINACCGHGDTDAAYIQRDDGTVVRGEEALSEVTAARPDQRSDAAEREESELRAISEAERAEEEGER